MIKGNKLNYDIEWVKQQENPTFFGFWGLRTNNPVQKCLTNFYEAPFIAETHKGAHVFKNSEQRFMYLKAEFFEDVESMDKLLTNQPSPKMYKKFGRQVRPFDENEWEDVKVSFMKKAVYDKFYQNPQLKEYLLSTGDKILVEASPYDRSWGIGMNQNDENFTNPEKWKGQNLLGFTLMTIRDELRKKQ